MTLLHLERAKPARAGWHRPPCLYPSCRRAAVRTGLCREHCGHVTDAHNVILDELGASVRAVASTVREGYVHLDTDAGSRRSGHALIMEATLGRPLKPGENVHHRNGNRADNRPHNLELWASYQPVGQRPADLAEYARELLGRYGTEAERLAYAGHVIRGGVG